MTRYPLTTPSVQVHIGTSGWCYPHWKEAFYPEHLSGIRMPEYCAQQFRCVEINSSFYRLPGQQSRLHCMATLMLLDALRHQTGEMRVVIDSTPSRLSDYGCPAAHDPVNNLPRDTGNLLVIAGARDQVVKPGTSRELLELAEDRGATVLRDPAWGHPFMDSHTQRRLEAVRRFLLQE